MATIILNQRVNDYDSWKRAYDEDHAKRSSMGIEELAVGQKAGNKDMAYMIWRLSDASPIADSLFDPELQEAMKEAGIISQHGMIILE